MRNFESEDIMQHHNDHRAPERYEAILTTTQRMVASRVCDILEDKDVPVMIEHVDVEGRSTGNRAGYRVLVPTHFLQTAAAAVGSYGEREIEVH